MISEGSLTMRALSGAHCTNARLYTLHIKIGTRTSAQGPLNARIVQLASDMVFHLAK